MIKVGITGGIGSGKSMCCKLFQCLGVPIYEADKEAKVLMDSDTLIVEGLKTLVGEEVYKDNKLDRALLAQYIFSNKELLSEVNKIVHPQVRRHFDRWCAQMERLNHCYIVYEAAILFESGFYTAMDSVIVVVSPLELRIERAMKRDNSSREEILKRINNQWSDDKKCEKSNYIIHNNNNQLLSPQVVDLHRVFSSENK